MTNPLDLDALTRKTRRLEFEDGLNDLQNALVFLMLGLASAFFISPAGIRFYIRAMLEYKDLALVGLIGLFALFVLITFGARRLIMRYRREFLWQDLGRIEPLRWQVDRKISVLAAAVYLIVVISGLILFTRDPMDFNAGLRVVAAAAGVATGLIYFAMGRTLQLLRYQWVGIIAGLTSGVLMALPLSAAVGWVGFSLIWGVGLTISGMSGLRRAIIRRRGEPA